MDKDHLAKLLKIEQKRAEAGAVEEEMKNPSFWRSQERAKQKSQRLSYLNQFLKKFEKAESTEELKELEKETLYSEQYDAMPAILSIHAGAGGTEAQDWAEMLLRMYMRFAEKKNYKTDLMDKTPGEEVGLKSASVRIEGPFAYGNLKGEAGVHRLVRISPYDADKARHTSFALVEVVPEFEDLADIEIKDKDLKVDVFRASGHGGQSVNTTDSAVRLTHLPTKTTVSVQNERSQLQNKEKALKILKIKLKKRYLDEKKALEQKIKGGHISAEWGNQIRSYVLQPYQQVKDHRTGLETSNPTEILNGNLDNFIESYLNFLKRKEQDVRQG